MTVLCLSQDSKLRPFGFHAHAVTASLQFHKNTTNKFHLISKYQAVSAGETSFCHPFGCIGGAAVRR